MKTTFETIHPRHAIHFLVILCLLVGLAVALPAYAQMSAEEHASHHGGPPVGTPRGGGAMSAGEAGAAPPEGAGPPAGAGGMGGMGGMMKNMGKVPPKALYPSLMDVPELTAEKRTEVLAQADERMKAGISLLSAGMDGLNDGFASNNYATMQAASAKLREGQAEFDSGVAAHQAIDEGKPPRDVALQWFRTEMSLPQPGVAAVGSGLSLFHLSMMASLILFAAVMILMYYFKMRRAAALFGRIEAGKGAPPPGSAPELAGGKPSEAEKPPSGSKAAAPPDKPAAAADKPAAGKPAAAADKPAASDKPDPAADKPAADKPAAAADKPAADKPDAPSDKPAAVADNPAAAAEKPAADKPAASDNKLDAAAEKLAAATEKLVTATEKLATAADKPAVPADKPAEGVPPAGKGSPPGVPTQERPAATRFTCHAPTARAVFLAGTFNGWDAKATPMVKDAQGNWEVAVDLPPGRHEFKFAVDGVLCCEPACQGTDDGCPRCVPNSSGTMNRMIEVRSI